MSSPPEPPLRGAVVAVSSNKGGVGKTTLATNLAVYARALREDLPVLLLGLDDQSGLDRMFALREAAPGDANLKHAWAERCLSRAIQLGEYGVHFVPSPPDVAMLKARAEDPRTLARILERTDFSGLVLIDTKSDLEALTRNAWCAADRILLPVADRASLEEAVKIRRLLERANVDPRRARVVLTLVDRRTRVAAGERHLSERLRDEARRCGFACYETGVSRSPRVELLNSGDGRPLSILHHAKGTAVHAELGELCSELLSDLGLSQRLAALARPRGEASEGPDELWGAPAGGVRRVRRRWYQNLERK